VHLTADVINGFYAAPEGAVVRRVVSQKVTEAWSDIRGLDILGIGYTTPYLGQFSEGRRVISAMPARQGAEIWPLDMKIRSTLVEEEAMPFPSGLFDRILIVHALEESKSPHKLLCEASRMLAPNGKLIVAVAARGGLWSHAEKTPLGHGQPYSRAQLEQALREAELEPLAWSHALFMPPIRSLLGWADMIERYGPMILPIHGGMILMEAGRRPFIAQGRAQERTLFDDLRGVLQGAPVPTT
jgi:SAM-dependent methyltransferase